MFQVISFLCLILGTYSASAPFTKPCKQTDAACLLSVAKESIPIFVQGSTELGIKTLDPMHIDVIKSDQGGLKLLFKDSTLKGLKDCQVENIKHDPVKQKQNIVVKCNLLLSGDYSLSGKLLILPIQGDGKYKIDISDILIKVSIDLATVDGADGKPHWHISKWHHTFKVLTRASFDFENLFNGDNTLARPVIQFANENWRDVIQEISPPIVKTLIGEVINAVEALYKAMPAEQLYIE